MTRFNDYDRALDMMDELRRRMDWLLTDQERGRPRNTGFRALYEDVERAAGRGAAASWPLVNLYDRGSELVLEADVPGLSEKDIRLEIHQDVLALTGERKADAPEGYSAHRMERAPVRFSRSFTLPCRVDAEKVTATLKHGVLTISMAKAPEAQPRQIQVQTR